MWTVLTVVRLTGGVLSMLLVLKLRLGALRNGGGKIPQLLAGSIAPKPLVVSDISEVSLGNILSMSHLLQPKIRLQLVLIDKGSAPSG